MILTLLDVSVVEYICYAKLLMKGLQMETSTSLMDLSRNWRASYTVVLSVVGIALCVFLGMHIHTAASTTPMGDATPEECAAAIQEAERYERHLNLSKQELIDQLTSDVCGMSEDAANYAVNVIDANWVDAAEVRARELLDDGYGKDAVLEQLTRRHGGAFTVDEVEEALGRIP